ncbi:MAG: hypothetical protein V1750_06175, partial [Acidobacteriota bacterium]
MRSLPRSSPLLAIAALYPLLVEGRETARPLTDDDDVLRFCLEEGAGHNCVLRDTTAAAHVIASSGERPRLVVAFPAENSGIGLWARHAVSGKVQLRIAGPLRSFSAGRLRGVRVALSSSAPQRIENVQLSNIRLLRSYHHEGSLDSGERTLQRVATAMARLSPAAQRKLQQAGLSAAVLRRRIRPRLRVLRRHPARLEATATSLDGRHRFLLRVDAPEARLTGEAPGLTITAPGSLRLEVEAAVTYPPPRPLPLVELLGPAARRHLDRLARNPALAERHRRLAAALQSLSFLSTRDRFLAGSWRFLTYFGRDTLISLWLLSPALAPGALEAGLQAVLSRLSPSGEVAHEESLGDQAALERLENFAALILAGGETASRRSRPDSARSP